MSRVSQISQMTAPEGFNPDSEILTTGQAAELCTVSRRTMLRWVNAGLLASHNTAGGRRRILRADLIALARKLRMPLQREPQAGDPRIVVIDDVPQVAEAVAHLARRCRPEADVRTATDGFTGGSLVASFRPHLVLLDAIMPGLNGIDVCHSIRSDPTTAGISIVIVSGFLGTESGLKEELLAAGASYLLSKPLEEQDLRRVLDDLWGPNSRVSNSTA